MDKTVLARLTAEVVSSYVGNPALTDGELDRAIEKLPLLIDRVHDALNKIMSVGDEEEGGEAFLPVAAASRPDVEVRTPAVPVDQSVFPESLICLEDGKSFKTLGRHLRSHHGMTPEEYRARWRLPSDYPMVCEVYAKSRSDVAKRIGLGVEGRGSAPAFIKPAARAARRRA